MGPGRKEVVQFLAYGGRPDHLRVVADEVVPPRGPASLHAETDEVRRCGSPSVDDAGRRPGPRERVFDPCYAFILAEPGREPRDKGHRAASARFPSSARL